MGTATSIQRQTTPVEEPAATGPRDDPTQPAQPAAPQRIDSPEITTVKIHEFTPFSPYLVTSWSMKPGNAPDINPNRDLTQFYDERYS